MRQVGQTEHHDTSEHERRSNCVKKQSQGANPPEEQGRAQRSKQDSDPIADDVAQYALQCHRGFVEVPGNRQTYAVGRDRQIPARRQAVPGSAQGGKDEAAYGNPYCQTE